jgi:hypothetical protein
MEYKPLPPIIPSVAMGDVFAGVRFFLPGLFDAANFASAF